VTHSVGFNPLKRRVFCCAPDAGHRPGACSLHLFLNNPRIIRAIISLFIFRDFSKPTVQKTLVFKRLWDQNAAIGVLGSIFDVYANVKV